MINEDSTETSKINANNKNHNPSNNLQNNILFDRKIKIIELIIKGFTPIVAIGTLWIGANQYLEQQQRDLMAQKLEIVKALLPSLTSDSAKLREAAITVLTLTDRDIAKEVLSTIRMNHDKNNESVIIRNTNDNKK